MCIPEYKIQLCSLVCPVGSSACPPRQAPNSLYIIKTVMYERFASLLKMYFALLLKTGNYLVLLLTGSKQLVFVWGISSLTEN